MRINEIFESIQGEGKYAGKKVLFIRVSGCTRNCDFCDTKYHKDGKEMSVKQIIKLINKYKPSIIVWTGGEPLLYEEEILDIRAEVEVNIKHHLETNGDIIPRYKYDYYCVSPKEFKIARNIYNYLIQDTQYNYDIKVVTDGKEMNKNLIQYATMLMPLSTYDEEKDKKIKQDVWNLCIINNLKYCLRQHVEVWGKKKGV